MSDIINRAAIHEPNPVPGSRDIYPLVLEDIKARVEAGKQKYGTVLQANNGRDALMDAYQEAIDLVMYLRQKIEEGEQAKSKSLLREENTLQVARLLNEAFLEVSQKDEGKEKNDMPTIRRVRTPKGHIIHLSPSCDSLSLVDLNRLACAFDELANKEIERALNNNIKLNRLNGLLKFAEWLEESGAGGSYSDFCDDFGYQAIDGEDRMESYHWIIQTLKDPNL